MSRFWNFSNSKDNENEVELRITGQIMDDDDAWIYDWFGIPNTSPNTFRTELAKHKGKNITVWIDSYGGDVFAAAGIYNALMEHKKTGGKVTVKIDGKAMSAASVIAMAGDEILISPVGMMMIHNPMSYISGGWGEARDFRHAAEVLDEVKETILNAYQAKTCKSRNKISEMMDNETYMSAKTAVKQCFADNILYTDDNSQSGSIENNFILSRLAIVNSMDDTKKKLIDFIKSKPQVADLGKQPLANTNQKQKGDEPVCKNVEELKNTYPELVKEIENAAKEEGVKTERNRIQDIEKISKNIDPELVNKAKYVEPIDAKELAFQAIQMDAAKGQKYLEDLKNDSTESKTNEVTATPVEQKTQTENKEAEDKVIENIAAGGNKRRGK